MVSASDSHVTDVVNVPLPTRQKKSKGRRKATVTSTSGTKLRFVSSFAQTHLLTQTPESLDAAALDPLGMATVHMPATSTLPPLVPASSSQQHAARQSFDPEFDNDPPVGLPRLKSSSRRKGGLKDQSLETPQLESLPATEGRRRCVARLIRLMFTWSAV